MQNLTLLLVLIPGLPLAAAILTALLGPRILRSQSHFPVILALLASFACSVLLVREVHRRQSHEGQENPAATALFVNSGFEWPVTLWTWAEVEDAYLLPPVPSNHPRISLDDSGSRDFRIDVTLRADALTGIMLAMVTFVSTLVAIFSVGYMHGDRSYWRFFSYLALFVFSMTMLVSVSNFVLLFVFWEAVGVCSYLLIGFWYHKPEAAAAGKKAFLVNRIGDFGFMLALFLIWTTYGTFNYHDSRPSGETDPATLISDIGAQLQSKSSANDSTSVVRGVLGKSRIAANDFAVGPRGESTLLAICLLLLLGACGKSAQFPLHIWLPDAMEGPTPVSALIHAATMVTAGVYLVARCTPLFMASPSAQLVVACVGGFTALMAGLIAVTQFDLKRVLAYSTISQLGYMFLALGTGTLSGVTAGMFHLFTHAFFKALLFLGAGSVMHAMGHVIDMRKFGGLRRVLPYTHWTFLAGCLALAGVVPFSGFWSKDAILAAVRDKSDLLARELETRAQEPQADLANAATVQGPGLSSAPLSNQSLAQLERGRFVYRGLYVAALFTAFVTAFYTFRAYYMTFFGATHVPREAGPHAHESPSVMLWPLAILAVCAIAVGGVVEGTQAFGHFLERTPSLAGGLVEFTRTPHVFHFEVAAVSSFAALAGVGIAAYLYLGDRRETDWLQSVLDFRWLTKLTDFETVHRLQRIGWVRAVDRLASRVGLGWLASLLGHIALLALVVLAAPLLLGMYLSPYRLSYGKFYVDELYDAVVVRPLRWLASACYAIDRWLVDGLVNACGQIPLGIGLLMRSLQMGLLQFYALVMVLGLLILLASKMIWASS